MMSNPSACSRRLEVRLSKFAKVTSGKFGADPAYKPALIASLT
jgi:hypothetical protein